MFSNVGMNPYGPGGTVVTASTQTPSSEPGQDANSTDSGQSAAAASKAETTDRVDPARQSEPAVALPQEARREDNPPVAVPASATFSTRFTPIVMPVPVADADASMEDAAVDAHSGPPPAFQRSPIEEQRAITAAPDPYPATISAPEPPEAPAEDAKSQTNDVPPVAAATEAASQASATAGIADTLLQPADSGSRAAMDGQVTASNDMDGPTTASLRPEAAPPPPPEPVEAGDPLLQTIRKVMVDIGPIDVPPPPESRAEAEFSSIRRMDAPYDTGTVDISR